MTNTAISISDDVLGGTPVFSGTRVPVNTLIEYLEAEESIDQFLEGFPSVTKEMAFRFHEEARDRAISAVSRIFFWMNVLIGGWHSKFLPPSRFRPCISADGRA